MSEAPVVAERLDSWKEIASYLGRSVRTVIRWEDEKGLPVRRIPGGSRHAVFAYPHEIDQWMQNEGGLIENEIGEVSNSAASIPLDQIPSTVASESVAASDPFAATSRISLKRLAYFGVAGLLVGAGIYSVIRFLGPSSFRYVVETQITDDHYEKKGLVTDGVSLYFGEWIGGRIVLSTVSTDGGPIREIATPFVRAEPVSIRGDGTRLLVLASEGIEEERALWIVPVPGGPQQRVGDVMCHSAAWSPDGSEIAFASGSSIYLTSDDGVSQHLLHSFASIPQDLRWSKDGNRIIFRLEDQTTASSVIWELSLNEEDRFALVSLAPLDPRPRNYTTISQVLDSKDDLLAGLEGINPTILELARSRRPWTPTFNLAEFKREMDSVSSFAVDSPSKQLFFLKGPSERYELEWFDERSRAFRPFLPGISAGDVDFSRDGRWITYVRKPENTLWVAKPDGGQARQINTSGMILIELPRWSPEGKRVAFMGKRAGSPWRIFTVPIEGGVPQEASNGTDNQGAPTWSPDGRRLVYGRVMCQEDRSCAVQEIDLASGKESMVPGSEGLSTARWSPDGQFIAALRTETHQVFLFNWRSGTWRKVADGANGNDLSWSPDSHTLYTSRPNGNLPEVLRISLHDGNVAPVADLSDFSKLSGRSDTWFAVTPDNSFLFMHIVGGQNVYSLQYSEK